MEPRLNMLGNELSGKVAKRLAGVHQLIAPMVPEPLGELMLLRVSQINGCALCVDMHTKAAAASGETQLRLSLVAVWREAAVFTDAERAAFALAEEGTRIADEHLGVSDETWAEARRHYDDDQLAAMVWLIALINAANRANVMVRNQGGEHDTQQLAAMAN